LDPFAGVAHSVRREPGWRMVGAFIRASSGALLGKKTTTTITNYLSSPWVSRAPHRRP